MMDIQKKYKYSNFVFVLINDFSLIAFSNAIEPLRLANREAQKELYTWKLMSETGENVKCSSGFFFKVDSPISQIENNDFGLHSHSQQAQHYFVYNLIHR